MKPRKSPLVISLLGLLLSASVAVAAAQTPQTPPAQGDQKKAESCCTGEGTESCCCCGGGSCDMMKHEKHNMKGHAADGSCCNMKTKAAKNKTKSKQKAG